MARLTKMQLLIATCLLASGLIACEGTVIGAVVSTRPADGESTDTTSRWAFDNDADYDFSSSLLSVSGGMIRVRDLDQADDDNSALGFAAASLRGATWSVANDRVEIAGTTGSCTSAANNCANLDAEWTPHYDEIVGYWELDGTPGAIASGATIPATIGPDAVVSGSSLSYMASARGRGINGSGQNDSIVVSGFIDPDNYDDGLTMAAWVKGAGSIQWDDAGGWGGVFLFTGWLTYRFGTGDSASDHNVGRIDNDLDVSKTMNHYVMTHANGTDRIYVNGVKVHESTGGLPLTNSSSTFRFAKNLDFYTGDAVLDEVAVWTTELSGDDVAKIYDRQRSAYSAEITSRYFDATQATNWSSLSWVNDFPYGKELPSTLSGESSTTYPSLVGSSLMDSILGVWHLNESSADSGPGSSDFANAVINANHGTAAGGPSYGVVGKLGKAVYLDGVNESIDVGLVNLETNVTASLWYFRRSEAGHVGLISNDNSCSGHSFSLDSLDDGRIRIETFGTDARNRSTSDLHLAFPRWVHIVWTSNGSTSKIFVDGVEAPLDNASQDRTANATCALRFGVRRDGGGFFRGYLDEVAVWNRVLGADEIQQIYQRGVTRLRTQVRTCASANCSDQEMLAGKGWKGSEGTNTSFFSNLHNNSSPLDWLGSVGLGQTVLDLSDFTSLVLATEPIFQYRIFLESDSTVLGLAPKLSSISVGPTQKPVSSVVVTDNPINYLSVSGFGETLGAGGCSAGVKYALSLDKTAWSYWNGSAWVSAVGGTASEANTASVVNTNIASFTSSPASLYVKAFLQSDGTTACELDSINVTHLPN